MAVTVADDLAPHLRDGGRKSGATVSRPLAASFPPSAAAGYTDAVSTLATTMRTSALDDTPRIVCERCGQQFGCSRDRIIDCWCVAQPYQLPLPPEAGNFGDCLCPSCLRSVAEALAVGGYPRLPNDR
jgi:hypothetical protein